MPLGRRQQETDKFEVVWEVMGGAGGRRGQRDQAIRMEKSISVPRKLEMFLFFQYLGEISDRLRERVGREDLWKG